MVGTFKLELLGIKKVKGKKDTSKEYYILQAIQGRDVIEVFLGEKTEKNTIYIDKISKLNRYDKFEADLRPYINYERNTLDYRLNISN